MASQLHGLNFIKLLTDFFQLSVYSCTGKNKNLGTLWRLTLNLTIDKVLVIQQLYKDLNQEAGRLALSVYNFHVKSMPLQVAVGSRGKTFNRKNVQPKNLLFWFRHYFVGLVYFDIISISILLFIHIYYLQVEEYNYMIIKLLVKKENR